MYKEEIIESGTVLKTNNGHAEVLLSGSDNCEECTAKLFCKPSEDNNKIIEVIDPFDSEPGDNVTISVEGKSIFKVSFLLYGVPLIILISVIIGGIELFKNSELPEMYAFLLSIAATGFYYLLFFVATKRKNNDNLMPKITKIL